MDETPNDAGSKTARRAKARERRLAPSWLCITAQRRPFAIGHGADAARRVSKASRPGRRAGPASRVVIALFRRFVPENFGVDLEPPAPDRPRATLRSLLTVANAKAFVHALLLTRLDRSGARIRTLALGMFAAYATLGVKLVVLGVSHDPPQTLKGAADQAVSGARPDLLDRNGEILATDVKTMSVFAEPNRIIDKDEAVELITAVLPDVDAKELRERLGSRKGFVWVKRQITPKEQAEIFHLGLPGVGFLPENKRVYPNGPIGAHVLGYVDKDNVGIAGMEKYLDEQSLTDPHVPGFVVDPESLKPVRLSLDLKADTCAARRTDHRHGSLSGQGRGRHGHRRQYRRSDRARNPAGLRSQPADRRARSVADQSHQRRRLRDGLDLQGAVDLDGARVGQGQSGLAHRRARLAALRPLHHPRFPRDPSRIDGAGSLHPFLEHRHGAHGADGRRRGAQGVPEEDGPARPAAHRVAGKRRAAGAEALGRTQHHDHRIRAGPQRRADPGGDGRVRAGQRRQDDAADLPDAHAGRSRQDQPSGRQRADLGIDALPHALQRNTRLGRASPTFPAITSAARPARPTRSSTATIRRTRFSPPSWRSRRPTSRNICI